MESGELERRFGVAGAIRFEGFQGLTRAQVTTTLGQATIYLQGAHLTGWQPAGSGPVIFTSRDSEFAPGKPIRGGIPLVFPWFATDAKQDRVDGHPGPSHGFARLQDWEMVTTGVKDGEARLQMRLGPTAMSRSMGFDRFMLAMEFVLGRTLTLRMTVENRDEQPLTFEDGFHSYYAVRDVHAVTLMGLKETPYIDKTDNFKVKPAAGVAFKPEQFTDRIYNGTTATCGLHDEPGRRKITVRKKGSNSTVVYNPWKALPDLGGWQWQEFLAVESANVGKDAVTVAAGGRAVLEMELAVEGE